MVPLLSNERITALDHFQDVRHLVFGTAGTGLTWEPGDALAILPRQSVADVHALLLRLGIPASAMVRIQLTEQPSATARSSSMEVRVPFALPDIVALPEIVIRCSSEPRCQMFQKGEMGMRFLKSGTVLSAMMQMPGRQPTIRDWPCALSFGSTHCLQVESDWALI